MITLLLVLLATTPVKEAKADLDGDGKEEAIAIGGDAGWTLEVNTLRVNGKAGENSLEGLTVVDIDSSDKKKEIAVHTLGEMDEDHLVVLYSWDGKSKKLSEMGRVGALSEVRGNGIVLVDAWAGFWSRREKHVVDKATRTLKLVPQELYWVGVDAAVKQSIPLRKSRTDATVIANLAPESKATVVACDPSPKDDDWYLIKSETGLVGWAKESVMSGGLELPYAD